MSFQQFNGYNNQACRDQDMVIVYLSPQQPIPETVPYELNGHITPDDWRMRLTAIKELASHYYKPLFEQIWFAVGFIMTIVLPIVVYAIILNTVYKDQHLTNDQFFAVRWISFGVFIGTILLFLVPLFIWKWIGAIRMRSMLAKRAEIDRRVKGPSAFIPTWVVKTPTVFKSMTRVIISAPPNSRPTVFHPDAYLPPYINAPMDGGAAYYYPYAPGKEGIPRMSVVGTLPAYNFAEAKNFEDVKV